jgi:hypothetical protein
MSLAGQLFYQIYHRPVGAVRSLVSEGGFFERRRTERGRQAMEAAARTLPIPAPSAGHPVELHLLTGRRFWYQTAFCLWTFALTSQRPLRPIIYDDGTLTEEFRSPLRRLFPEIQFVAQSETIARLDAYLPANRFPALRERWLNYPNIRKLTDPHIGRAGWKLVLDSDLLFFRSPEFLLNWIDAPGRPLHAVDCETSYGYSRPLMTTLAGEPIAELVNVGVTGLRSEPIDWEQLEFWTHTLQTRERTSYYLEQALIAMMVAGQDCSVAPAHDYVTLPEKPEALNCGAIMHHYVANSKRWYFQHNWQRAIARLQGK